MKKRRLQLVTVIGVLVLLTLGYVMRHSIKTSISTLTAHIGGTSKVAFPAVPIDTLTSTQSKLLSVVKTEYVKYPVSYDATVLKYTQNSKEAWCADFSSWVMLQVGAPYTNPNSGSWRIPGVLTLKDYYAQHDRYNSAGSYHPQIGDVAFFIGKHDLFINGQHVAIVIKVDGQTMTTIGGNDGGKLLLRTQNSSKGRNLVGFGRLD